MGSSHSMEDFQGSFRSTGHHLSRYETSYAMVDVKGEYLQRSSTDALCPRYTTVDRRIGHSLGGSLERPFFKRNLDRFREEKSHQCPRAQSSPPHLSGLAGSSTRSECHGLLGQLDSRSPHKQTRGNQVSSSLSPQRSPQQLGLRHEDFPQSPSYSRKEERYSGRPVQTRVSPSDGMVPIGHHVSKNSEPVVSTPDRPVCHKVQLQDQDLFLPSAGRPSPGGGRVLPLMGRSPSLRVPSGGSHPGTTAETQTVGLRDDTSGTPVAKTALVPGSPVQDSGSPQRNPTISSLTQAAPVLDLPPQPGVLQLTRLEAIQQAQQATGISQEVSLHLLRRNRESSRDVYDGKWKVYCRWCNQQQVDPRFPSVNTVCKFFVYLFDNQSLSFSAIGGYRAMLSSVLKHTCNINLTVNPLVSELMSSFRSQRPHVRLSLPDWDVTMVLLALTKAPFEPVSQSSLKHLTLKTFFLLLLASGRRRSDIYALDISRIYYKEDGSAVLYPDRAFLPKTRAAIEGNSAFTPITIPSLSHNLTICIVG